MSRELARARERYRNDADIARRKASLILIPHIGLNFFITGWTSRGREAYADHWQSSCFDWPEIYRRHNEPDRLELAIWASDNRLCGLGLGLTTGGAVELRFLEGCRTEDCPLKGFRAAIALEAVACYAQLRGKPEIKVNPINDRLRNLYVDLYGFDEVRKPNREPYFRRMV